MRGGLLAASIRGGLLAALVRTGLPRTPIGAGLLAGLLCLAVSAVSPAGTGASEPAAAKRSALVIFLSTTQTGAAHPAGEEIERELALVPTFSTGIMSASQGAYTTAQLVLDITQGARISDSAYTTHSIPFLSLPVGVQVRGHLNGTGEQARGPAASNTANKPASRGGQVAAATAATGQVQDWHAVVARAHSAPQLLEPGLLASSVPGGSAYVPADGVEAVDGVLAADRSGHVAGVLGSSSTLLSSVDALGAQHRLVVADLPPGPTGYADLRTLSARRPAGELIVVIERVPDEPNNSTKDQIGHELLWVATAGLGPGGRMLTSQTTNQRGLIASIDIAPTILAHLGLRVPGDMRGKPIKLDGSFPGAAMRALKARLEVITGRRLPALAWLVVSWALLLAAVWLPMGVRRGREARRAWALRTGALAMMWTPVAVLLPATLEPSRTVEFSVIVATCFTLAALTDSLVKWPRAPIVPALAAVLAVTVDALAGTQLLVRSLLGPDPILGARFYGIGNELKSGLAVLVFTAVAAALYPAVRSRRAAAAMAGAGILLAIVEGSARIGAGVGGVILVSAGTAVAAVMLLPGTLNRKRILVVMTAPVLGLIALATIDLLTAHGGGHFTGSVLDARSAGDVRDIIVRRYGAAWNELKNHLMPLATALALIASVAAVHQRDRVCAPVDSDPAWLAALAGGLTSGMVGALTEDSGPVLLVVAVFVLGCVLGYLWGRPLSPLAREAVDRAIQGRTERSVLRT
jgi:hypothetical protein